MLFPEFPSTLDGSISHCMDSQINQVATTSYRQKKQGIVLPLPNRLKNQWDDMKITLAGAAPINKKIHDSYVWEPSGGNFTVKSRYKFRQPINNLEKWNLRSAVWKNECLPKIKLFAWTLLKGKILIMENLRKKGIQGHPCVFYARRRRKAVSISS